MKFTILSAAAALITSVSTAPLDIAERDGHHGIHAVIKCPFEPWTSGDQTYFTVCGTIINPIGSHVISTIHVKNFRDCLAHCTASADAGQCCKSVDFQRKPNTCTLYSSVSGLIPVGRHQGRVTGTAISCRNQCPVGAHMGGSGPGGLTFPGAGGGFGGSGIPHFP